jgi:hypothetical protein
MNRSTEPCRRTWRGLGKNILLATMKAVLLLALVAAVAAQQFNAALGPLSSVPSEGCANMVACKAKPGTRAAA